jgi:hypothetical protein
MTTNDTKQPVKALFRPPRDTEWRPLHANTEDEDQKKRAKNNLEELHNTLLSSLQMQHLVVLAGSGCSLSAGGPSMSDLWNAAVGEPATAEAQNVATTVSHDLLNNKNIEMLLSRIEASLQLNEQTELLTFLNNSKQVILQKCSDFLAEGKLEAHRRFLHRLSRRRVRDQRLKIFTTNYDLCFERAAGALGGIIIDGFSFTAPRRYDPRYFNYDLVRRPRSGEDASYLEGVFLLYKLHGSVNWARNTDGTLLEETNPAPETACLIYPAAGKYQQSFSQPHLESMAQYLAAVREPNTCVVVVGFGFNDAHLSEPLLAAAQSNPHLRVIIVDPFADDQARGVNKYWQAFDRLARKGEDIWFVAADFEAFTELVPDLKSLTPADSLMKAIQGAIKPS